MRSSPGRPWRLPPRDPDALRLAIELGISPPLGRLLWARGFCTVDAARAFLHPSAPDPRLLPQVDIACQRLGQAKAQGERVLIFGDYDADGVCSSALLLEAFSTFGLDVSVHLPSRQDGYGLRAADVLGSGASLCVAVDNGTTAIQEVETLRAAGIDVIIADHHQPVGPLPPALAIVNPWTVGPDHPLRDLSGTGVAWGMVRVLGAHLGLAAPASLDLVAIGTIADQMDLAGPNRYLVRAGLEMITSTPRPGLSLLLRSNGVDGSPSPRDIAFTVAPRLNAPGRLGDPRPALDLLLCRDEPSAMVAVAVLQQANSDRQRLAGELLARAEAAASDEPQRGALVLASPDWPRGLLGPAAAALCERLGVPVLLAEMGPDGICRGSGRCPEGFDLTAALAACQEHLLRFGGHAQAAGFEVRSNALPALSEALSLAAGEPSGTVSAWEVDGELDPDELTIDLARECAELLEPFGAGNPEPLFRLGPVKVQEARRVGGTGRHLRLQVRAGAATLPAIAFDLGRWAAAVGATGGIELLGCPTVNRYRGRESLQLTVADLRPVGDWAGFLTAARSAVVREHPDRDTLAQAFRRLRSVCRQEPAWGQSEAILRQHLVGFAQPDAILIIFREAGLLTDAGLVEPTDGAKVDLRQSVRYRQAAEEHAALRAVEELLEGEAQLPVRNRDATRVRYA